jgi:hypothetical protein
MIPNNPPDSYRRAAAIAEAHIEVDKWSVVYSTGDIDGDTFQPEIEVEDYACVVNGLLLFPTRAELEDFHPQIGPVVKMADAMALEIAEEIEWQERRERRAMDRYYEQTR